MKEPINTPWKQYEAGKDYNRRIGLYETVRRNERFYRGDQWQGATGDLPHPVFNLIRRITDYLVGSVVPGDLSIHYSDDGLPFVNNANVRKKVADGIALLTKHAAYRWKQSRMDALTHRALLDAAISGDGVFYCWWDNDKKSGQVYAGDIRTDIIDTTNLFVADVNSTDLQSQDYVILAGRATVASLRREALENGVSPRDATSIVGDRETETRAGELASVEQEGAEKATYLLKFYRDEEGEVILEKWTRTCCIRRTNTGLRFYPVAYFQWHSSKSCYHGNAPVSDMIANQKYINSAYALMMKHMTDTAFSKVIYDKSRIPEWSNEVGEAIAAVGGGNVADAVSVVGTGEMQEGYLDLIRSVIENTKSMMGATESALGDEDAYNTSAILVLQQASQIALAHVVTNLCQCISELASIWADMLCTYCPSERLIPVQEGEDIVAREINFPLLKQELLNATAEAGHVTRYTPASTVALLDRLLSGGYINVRQYLEHLPSGCITDREDLLRSVNLKGAYANE